MTVSPGAGSRGLLTTMSAFTLPTTTIRGIFMSSFSLSSAAERPSQSGDRASAAGMTGIVRNHHPGRGGRVKSVGGFAAAAGRPITPSLPVQSAARRSRGPGRRPGDMPGREQYLGGSSSRRGAPALVCSAAVGRASWGNCASCQSPCDSDSAEETNPAFVRQSLHEPLALFRSLGDRNWCLPAPSRSINAPPTQWRTSARSERRRTHIVERWRVALESYVRGLEGETTIGAISLSKDYLGQLDWFGDSLRGSSAWPVFWFLGVVISAQQ